MPEPTLADVHVDAALTDFSSAFFLDQDSFTWSRFAPIRGVGKQSDKYHVWDRADFFRTEARKRAPNTEAAVRGAKLSQASYYCDVYAIAFDVSEQIRANSDPAVDVEESAARLLAQDLNLRAELDAASAFLDTASVWGTDQTITTKWADAASTPIENITTGIKTVAKAIGRRPNTLLLGGDVWYDGLLNHPDIIARLPDNAPRIASIDFVANLLGLSQVLVVAAPYNSADEGATASVGFAGGKNAVVAYVDPAPGLASPTAAVSFSWTGLVGASPAGIRTKRMMIPYKDALPRIESDHALDFKVVASAAGYRMAAAVA